jgi:inhibitor of KinA
VIQFPGPSAALVTLPVPADEAGLLRVLELDLRVRDRLGDLLLETVPAFNRLLVLGDPMDWDRGKVEVALAELAQAALEADPETLFASNLDGARAVVELPACYDPDLAPDLVELAEGAGLTVAEVTALHSWREYVVLATGFAPGFPYLGDVAGELARPRHPSPRPLVPAGSVGIADRRTGVYPSDGPGGWQLVARVPRAWFADPEERVARFQPGSRVRFRPITPAEFEAEGG